MGKVLAKLDRFLDTARFLYNCALEHRIVNYNQWKQHVSYYDQRYTLKDIRKFDSDMKSLNQNCEQHVLKRLDLAFQVFFRRLKQGEKPGFPRFKSKNRFHSLTYTYNNGIRIKNGKLYVQNLGNIKINMSREIQGNIKTVTLTKRINRWYVCFSCDNVPAKSWSKTDKVIGIDVGLTSFLTDSDGNKVINPRYFRKSQKQLRLRQRRLARRKKGSNRYKKARLLVAKSYEHIQNQRTDFLHKLSTDYVRKYNKIYVEDLKIKNMVKNRCLSKSIHDASWGQFFNYLFYKAEEAGRVFARVDPKNTTQMCSRCGAIIPKDLFTRVHNCPHCGLVMDRDFNAALNVKHLGETLLSDVNVSHWTERSLSTA